MASNSVYLYLLKMKGSSTTEVTMIHAILLRIQYFHNCSKTIISCISIMIKFAMIVIASKSSDIGVASVVVSLLPRS